MAVTRPVLVLLNSGAAVSGWGIGGWGTGTAAGQSSTYENLVQAGSPTALVYAMKGKSCEAGSYASRTWGISAAGPWYCVGSVVASDDSSDVRDEALRLAIFQQRSLLLASAREQHGALRPYRTLILAWCQAPLGDGALSIGSFYCPDCGHHNDASRDNCENCGAARPATAPRGRLSLANRPVRSRLLAKGSYGFKPAGG